MEKGVFILTNVQERFEDTKGIIRICKSKKDRQHNGRKKGQRDKQRSTKHTHKTSRSSNTNPTNSDSDYPFGIFKLIPNSQIKFGFIHGS